MKIVAVTQIAKSIYDVKNYKSMFPEKKAFDDLPHHRRLHYLCAAKDFIKVFKKIGGNVEVVNGGKNGF